jgi:CheY-like chemotaxis protein
MNMAKQLPYIYHPTAAVFIDDQELFIHSTLAIVENLINCHSFLDPEEALNYLQKIKVGGYFLKNFTRNDQEGAIVISQKALIKYLGSLERFAMESTLIIDYAMPKLNGLELCEKLADQPFKKIMFTGEAGSDIADKALKRHLIDRFIHKNSPKVFEALNESLLELRMEFFDDLMQTLSLPQVPKFFVSQAFSDFFMQVFDKYKGVEYYLINTYGDFLIIDVDGRTTWLCVRDEAGHEAIKAMLEAQAKKKPGDDVSFAYEHLKKGRDYLLAYGFGTFDKGYQDLVLPTHPIKFDRYQCHYAALPVKLDLKIKPLSLQRPQYRLSKSES